MAIRGLSLRQLQLFVEIAKRGSFVRAAEALHLTPPAVTMKIKELESALELPLFDRRGRSVSLTTAGEYFLVYAKRILSTLKDAEDAMARLRRTEVGVLTIGLVSTAKYFVPRLLVAFRGEHPGIEVRLQVSGNREQLVALLEENAIDLAIMGRPPRELATRAEPFAAHPLVFIAPPAATPLELERSALVTLETQPFLVREPGSGTRRALEDYFRQEQITPRVTMEMSSNETIKQAVMAGMGVSFLSLHTLGLELQSGLLRLLDLPGTPVMRTWNLVRLQAKVLSPAAEAFRYFVLEHAEATLAARDAPLLAATAPR